MNALAKDDASANPVMSAPPAYSLRPIAWDGLSLAAPVAWEPARLGRGYMLLEDATGPRLGLRWQRVAAGFAPEKALKRLGRKKQLGLEHSPGAAAQAVLEALPPQCRALACTPRGSTGQREQGVLFLLPGGTLAVVAALFPRPGDACDAAAPDWGQLALSLTGRQPGEAGELALYDIAARVPPGFALAAFSINLGHFHIHYRRGGDSLDFSRFAPAEVVLRNKSLLDWARDVFAPTLGAKRLWMAGELDAMEAVASGGYRQPGFSGALRAVFSRMYSPAKWRVVMAWRPDASKILAVSASHSGGLDAKTFEEICRNYVVVQTS